MKKSREDAALSVTKALPNGAATVYSDGINLGLTPNSDFYQDCELVIEAPLLVVGDLANASTMTYFVQMDSDPAFGSPTTFAAAIIVQTGAGGVGAAATSTRVKLPSNVESYIRVGATNSNSGDASDKSFTAKLVF